MPHSQAHYNAQNGDIEPPPDFYEPMVLIDGAVPRSDLERLDVLLGYMESIARTPGNRKVYASLLRQRVTTTEEFAHELEDEIVSCINVILPDGWALTIGEANPGDAIVAVKEEA